MRPPLACFVVLTLPCTACFGDAPRIDATGSSTGAASSSGTTGTSGIGSSDTSAASVSDTDADSGDTSDTGGPAMCGPGGVPVPTQPPGWSMPFFAYGLSTDFAMAPDCGGGTQSKPLGTREPDTSSCNCVCDEPPHELCSISVETCTQIALADVNSDCLDLDGPPAGVGFFPTPGPPCESTLRVVPKGSAPLAFRCDAIVEDGCTSAAPMADGLCVVTDGDVAECPPGYDAAPPRVLEDPRCEGTCDPCDPAAYCNATAVMEHFDALACGGTPFAQTTAEECAEAVAASVRMAPIPAMCAPTDGGADPTPISVCCAP